VVFCAATILPAFGQTPAPSIRIVLPERTRLLKGQLVDLVIEVRNATAVSGLNVSASGIPISCGAAKATPLDCDTSSDWVYRADLQSFNANVVLTATVTADGKTLTDTPNIQVQQFNQPQRRNIILLIGDAMGTAYRDAARLVDRAIVDANGKNSFRGGTSSLTSPVSRFDGELLSLTRNWEQERPVDELFPEAESKVYHYPDKAHPEYAVCVRRLSGGLVLMAMGSAKKGEPTGKWC
jgi:hypothetical protein